MTLITDYTDANWESSIGSKPALILITDGDGIRSDFNIAFKKAATENKTIQFIQINPTQNPEIASRFDVKDKPVLVAWLDGEVLNRRTRPWGSDVPLITELLLNAYKDKQPISEQVDNIVEGTTNKMIETKPIAVTDENFQKEAIDYSNEMPVLVDFWAEWCGPCRTVGPILDKLAEAYAGKIRIAKVNVDENPGLSQAFRIMSIPTIMAIKSGQIVFSQPGAFPEAAFRELIDKLIELEIPEEEAEEETPAN